MGRPPGCDHGPARTDGEAVKRTSRRFTRRETRSFLPIAAAGLTAGILLGRVSDALLPVLPAALLAVGALFLLPRGRRAPAGLALACALGFLLGQLAYHPQLPP